MLSCVGVGAIVAALRFPQLARTLHARPVRRHRHAGARRAVGADRAGPEVWVAVPAMVVIGMAWISVANSLTVAAQQAMPDWVRARGMSIYQMALMGGSAAGSLLWGQVASLASVRTAVLSASVFGLLLLLAGRRLSVELDRRARLHARLRQRQRARAGVRDRPGGRAGDGDAGIPDRPRARGRLRRR
jgi:MFS family permease